MNAMTLNLASVEVEQALCGACLNIPAAVNNAHGVMAEHFASPVLGRMWHLIQDLALTGGDIAPSVVVSRLKADPEFASLGGKSYLADLIDKAPPANTVPTLAAELVETWKARQGALLGDQMVRELAKGGPVGHVLAYYGAELDKIQSLDSQTSRYSPEPFAAVAPVASPWLIKGVLPSKGVGFIVGQTKAGKSFLALDTCLRLAAGAPKIFGARARRAGVVYIAGEDDNGCRARVLAWRRKHHRATPMPFELIGQGLNLLDPSAVHDLKRALHAASDRFGAIGCHLGVVVIDTLSRCAPGADENSSADMSRAFHALEDIARSTGALVLVVAHFGKAGADKGIRGWSGLDANSDATLTVERSTDDDAVRVVTFAKVKNGVDGGQIAFRLEEVGLGMVDDDGEELTSCVVAFETLSDRPERQKRSRALKPPEALVLAAVRYVTDHEKTLPLPAAIEGQKPWMKAVTREQVRLKALAMGLAEDTKSSAAKMRFSRSLEGLCAARKLRIEGDLLWLI